MRWTHEIHVFQLHIETISVQLILAVMCATSGRYWEKGLTAQLVEHCNSIAAVRVLSCSGLFFTTADTILITVRIIHTKGDGRLYNIIVLAVQQDNFRSENKN